MQHLPLRPRAPRPHRWRIAGHLLKGKRPAAGQRKRGQARHSLLPGPSPARLYQAAQGTRHPVSAQPGKRMPGAASLFSASVPRPVRSRPKGTHSQPPMKGKPMRRAAKARPSPARPYQAAQGARHPVSAQPGKRRPGTALLFSAPVPRPVRRSSKGQRAARRLTRFPPAPAAPAQPGIREARAWRCPARPPPHSRNFPENHPTSCAAGAVPQW